MAPSLASYLVFGQLLNPSLGFIYKKWEVTPPLWVGVKTQGDCVSGRQSRHYLRVSVSIPSILVISSPSFEKGVTL